MCHTKHTLFSLSFYLSNQGRSTYTHRVIVETSDPERPKEILTVKCVRGPAANHTVSKRNVLPLPAGFQEPEDLEITTELTERAPRPQLSVGVRQGGQPITGELNVNPGTPLQMDVYLDKASAPIYGLLVSYMQVTDTKNQEETIIFNGCSFDPHLFENFNTVDGDFLTAKFRAFKFPDSTFVQFKATVNVCLDKCQGVECSNGQVGYGRRRRRAVPDMAADPNAIYKVTMITFIKVDYSDDELLRKGPGNIIRADSELPPRRRNATPVLATNGLADADAGAGQQRLQLAGEHVREELAYTVVQERGASAATPARPAPAALALLLLLVAAAALLRPF
ncbi:Cuticlin-6 [Frankliniella fusca]|uniref:Cuticlin-6 n=1 Tax=Frankliniella fusca TaxID=407009 RepID=A0AAE1GWE4_9NEOP|nr:Cuticlin-6 [Frankliniella fusca]